MKNQNVIKKSPKNVIERFRKWLTKISEDASRDYQEQNRSINYEHLYKAAYMKYFW